MKSSFISCIIFSVFLSVNLTQSISQPVVLGDPSPQPPNPHFYWTKYPGAVRYSGEVYLGVVLISVIENVPDTQTTIAGGFTAGFIYYFRVRAYTSLDTSQWSPMFPFWIGYTGINKISENIPSAFSLSQNYPNPFNPSTKIKFDVPNSPFEVDKGDVKLVVYYALGIEITTLVNGTLSPGTYETEWNASNYASGIYYYRLISGDYSETKKMILIK
jgi:hypothetical protein